MVENAYERLRMEKIKRNRQRLIELKIHELAPQHPASTSAGHAGPNSSGLIFADAKAASRSRAKGSRRGPPRAAAVPARASKRIRGEAPAPQAEVETVDPARSADGAGGTSNASYTVSSRARIQAELPRHVVAAPFTLTSIGTTVVSLGSIYRGEWRQRWWSNRGCLFHHAYPVGYQATKRHFERDFAMWIEGGDLGPVFCVRDEATGKVFSGNSPTAPWTQVCVWKKLGTRISGPLFFGFSDPVTQGAIAKLYTPDEWQAALDGSRAWAPPEERSLRENAAVAFGAIAGVGEGVALALATTRDLGGEAHAGPDALAAWLREDPQTRGRELLRFLLGGDEMPRATLKWPAWTDRLAPQIAQALMSHGQDGKA